MDTDGETRKHLSPTRASSPSPSVPPTVEVAVEQPVPMEASSSGAAVKPVKRVIGADNDHLPEELRDRANDCFGQSSDVSEVFNRDFIRL